MNNKIKWFSVVRVTGLLAVLIYHFFIGFMPGGFLGVDVFFASSGYLITAMMIEECRKTGGFDLSAFFKRRFLRIFPPLLIMVITMLPLALLISPDFTVGIDRQSAAALGFVTNYFEIKTGGSYEAQLFPHLFLHTWSLAVEAHFYIIWALVCAFILRRLSRGRYPNPQMRLQLLKEWLFIAACILAVLSYMNMQVLYARAPADPSNAYFATTSHSFPFLIGAAFATIMGISIKKKRRAASTGMLALCTLAASVVGIFVLSFTLDFKVAATYRFGCLITALLSVVAIGSARMLHEFTPKQQEPRWLSATADLSYCIYLFHWPLFIIFSQLFDNRWIAVLMTMLVTLPLSALVFGPIEGMLRQKVRYPGQGRGRRTALAVSAIVCIAMSGMTLSRAPVISTVERDLNIAYVHSDTQQIRNFVGEYIALAEPAEEAEAVEALPAMSLAVPDLSAGFPGGVQVIGDSVCLGAARDLTKRIPNCKVDAKGSRTMGDGFAMVMKWQNSGKLKEYIVIALGVNVTNDVKKRIDQIIVNVKPGHRIVFVTPYNGRLTGDTSITVKTANYLRTLPELYPFVTVADWAAMASSHKELMGTDKLHIGGSDNAIRMYTICIMQALFEASQKTMKPDIIIEMPAVESL